MCKKLDKEANQLLKGTDYKWPPRRPHFYKGKERQKLVDWQAIEQGFSNGKPVARELREAVLTNPFQSFFSDLNFKQMMLMLPRTQRHVALMVYKHNYTFKDVSTRLYAKGFTETRISEAAVGKRVGRIIKTLRRGLKN